MTLTHLINSTQERVNSIISRVLKSTIVSKLSNLLAQFLNLLSVNAPEKVVSLVSVVLVLTVGSVVIKQIMTLVNMVGSKLGLAISADVSSSPDNSISSTIVKSKKGSCESSSCVVKHKCSSSSSSCSDSSYGVKCANGCGKQKCANGCGYAKCTNGCGSCSSSC